MNSIGGQCGVGAPLGNNQIGGESFIRHIGNDKLIFDFHEGSGTTVHDKSHCGNNGVLGDGADTDTFPTWKRNSLYFDGGDYIDMPPINFGMNFTIEFFVKITTLYNYGALLGKTTYLQLLTYADGKMSFIVGDGNWGHEIFTIRVLSNGEYYLITATYNGSHSELFLNAVSKGTGVNIKDVGSTDFWIGAEDGAGYYLRGIIKKVRIESRVPSQIEIQQNYLANKFGGNN